jgi:hypothetical protein
MPIIMVLLLAMLSPVQAIIAAEAGVNAKAENIAAVISIFFMGTSLKKQTSVLLAIEVRMCRARRFTEKKFSRAATEPGT